MQHKTETVDINVVMQLTFGRTSKNGPIQSRTNANIAQETTDVSWVRPPDITWTVDRDNEADNGRHEKHDPIIFDAPNANNSWLKSIS